MLDFAHKSQFGTFELRAEANAPVSGMTALFGSSGSGKTSLLRSIAGFSRTEGHTIFNDEVWFDSTTKTNVPPYKRPACLVFQKPLLFGHLSVKGNLEYPLRYAKNRPHQVELSAAIEAFDLPELLTRRIGSLSGGETQRVALARALLSQPKLLLLDEPLSGLDDNRKAEILPYLKRISIDFHLPTIYVSHALDELVSICDHMLVINNGRIVDEGETHDVFERLNVSRLAGRLETGTLLTGVVVKHDLHYRLTHVDIHDNRLVVPLQESIAKGDPVQVKVRARDVAIATSKPENLSIRNVLSGAIDQIDSNEESPYAECVVNIGPTTLRARVTRASVDDLQLTEGKPVFALIKSVTFE